MQHSFCRGCLAARPLPPRSMAYLKPSGNVQIKLTALENVFSHTYLRSMCMLMNGFCAWFRSLRVLGRSRYLEDFRARDGYAPLFKSFENFFTRRLYHRIQVGWMAWLG